MHSCASTTHETGAIKKYQEKNLKQSSPPQRLLFCFGQIPLCFQEGKVEEDGGRMAKAKSAVATPPLRIWV